MALTYSVVGSLISPELNVPTPTATSMLTSVLTHQRTCSHQCPQQRLQQHHHQRPHQRVLTSTSSPVPNNVTNFPSPSRVVHFHPTLSEVVIV